ncbi:RNA polymerase sigma factor [Phytomonospora endophytica]|uniref:RNA polymerase sigma-70 factor (ECF subfamily) n=1 Tax=Phytomonospora endophytica TaxID=714109 RepID=A0A841FF64_9ACTN|nr:RNA polymerase sigma factor [Phytomonospora endophytica]MBB6035951.1 RNA polymerase sigma-70 factor (ECF subfamily) [Phytomonospora endophytica]GIG66857.1 DNA-directed RNA polymerase sigma-70 factor [Phytomonospora endophytica]
MTADGTTRIGSDPAAFESFYRAHITAVQRFVARRIAEPFLAADLVAEVFLAAIGSAKGYRPSRGTPRNWLYGVARNVIAAEHKRQAKFLVGAIRAVGMRRLDPDDLARAEERIDAEARARELYRAMDGLPKGERAVLELVALDGLDVAEAARVLGVKPGTARVRLHRARRRVGGELTTSAPATAHH